MDYSLLNIGLLIGTGLLAGVINTLAGGGSNLTLPALMLMGMPADVANATNRVGILLQSLEAMRGFRKHGKLPTQDIMPMLVIVLIGGLLGALTASYAPTAWLKPALLGAMLAMALIILLRPSVIAPPAGTPAKKVLETPQSWWALGIAGFYGGFVQAGVGFILIAALAGSLRYDLVRTNALKVICAFAFTAIALLIFVYRDQVLWGPGLLLALGSVVGANLAVKIALKVPQKTMKWFLFLMTLFACAAAMSR